LVNVVTKLKHKTLIWGKPYTVDMKLWPGSKKLMLRTGKF